MSVAVLQMAMQIQTLCGTHLSGGKVGGICGYTERDTNDLLTQECEL